VRVGSGVCAVEEGSRTHNGLRCVLPPGGGAKVVSVHTPLQSSLALERVVYAGPSVASVATPMGRGIEGGFPVEVVGEVGVSAWLCEHRTIVYTSCTSPVVSSFA
jgi:hypothetical protein